MMAVLNTQFMISKQDKVVSEHHIIEFSGENLKYRPRFQSRHTSWLAEGLPRLSSPRRLKETGLAEGEIPFGSVRSFRADSGISIFNGPVICLTFTVNNSTKTIEFTFSEYFIEPRKPYFKMLHKLRLLGLKDESDLSRNGLRKLSLLVIPIMILSGYLILKMTSGFAALFGVLMLIQGILYLVGSIIEGIVLIVMSPWRSNF